MIIGPIKSGEHTQQSRDVLHPDLIGAMGLGRRGSRVFFWAHARHC